MYTTGEKEKNISLSKESSICGEVLRPLTVWKVYLLDACWEHVIRDLLPQSYKQLP